MMWLPCALAWEACLKRAVYLLGWVSELVQWCNLKHWHGKMDWFRRSRELSLDAESRVCISSKFECGWMDWSIFWLLSVEGAFSTFTYVCTAMPCQRSLVISSQHPSFYRDARKTPVLFLLARFVAAKFNAILDFDLNPAVTTFRLHLLGWWLAVPLLIHDCVLHWRLTRGSLKIVYPLVILRRRSRWFCSCWTTRLLISFLRGASDNWVALGASATMSTFLWHWDGWKITSLLWENS